MELAKTIPARPIAIRRFGAARSATTLRFEQDSALRGGFAVADASVCTAGLSRKVHEDRRTSDSRGDDAGLMSGRIDLSLPISGTCIVFTVSPQFLGKAGEMKMHMRIVAALCVAFALQAVVRGAE